jgi:hypothetical protein
MTWFSKVAIPRRLRVCWRIGLPPHKVQRNAAHGFATTHSHIFKHPIKSLVMRIS